MKQAVLISIHPEHIDNIMSGKKVFEYRKILPKHDILFLVLYCTAPVKKITAVAEVLGRVVGSPAHVWNVTSFGSGIPRRIYHNYYSARQSASSFVLGNVYEITNPMNLSDLPGKKTPPRSFYYLSDADMKEVFNRKSANSVIPPSVFFVGGVHGVGKTTLCEEVSKLGGYRHITASSLTGSGQEKNNQGKQVEHVVNNQAALLQNLEPIKARYSRVLLDGHFTLINDKNEIEPVDIQVFDAMKPRELILIKGCPSRIASRLKDRDGEKWDIPFVRKFQAEEEKYARYVSEKISVPLRVFNNDVRVLKLARAIYS